MDSRLRGNDGLLLRGNDGLLSKAIMVTLEAVAVLINRSIN